MASNSKVLLALLTGAAVGSALGLLLAPASGKQSRKRISDTAQDLSDKILQKAEEFTCPRTGKVKVNAEATLEKGKSYIKQQM